MTLSQYLEANKFDIVRTVHIRQSSSAFADPMEVEIIEFDRLVDVIRSYEAKYKKEVL